MLWKRSPGSALLSFQSLQQFSAFAGILKMSSCRMKKVNSASLCTALRQMAFQFRSSVTFLSERSELTFFRVEKQHFASTKWGTAEGGQESFRNFSSSRNSGNCLGLCLIKQISLMQIAKYLGKYYGYRNNIFALFFWF